MGLIGCELAGPLYPRALLEEVGVLPIGVKILQTGGGIGSLRPLQREEAENEGHEHYHFSSPLFFLIPQ